MVVRSPFRLLASLFDRLSPTGDVTQRTVRSGVWVMILNVGERSLQLLKLVVLAGLLSPDAFGLLGIALLTIAVLRRFSRLGFDTALIQRVEENVDAYLDTMWSIEIVRGLLISVIVYLAAPFVAAFFDAPGAVLVIRLSGLIPLLAGFENPAVVYLQKDLQFDRFLAYRLSATVFDLIVAVGAALALGNVLALVYGQVVGAATRLGASYFIESYRPTPSFDVGRAREMFGYGKWITGTSILNFVVTQGDDAFVGWFLGTNALGLYQVSYRLANAPATELTDTISSVVFPAYSKVQSDVQQLREGYYETIRLVTAVAFPAATGIILVTPSFIQAFLGPEWTEVTTAMRILAMYGFVASIGATVGPLFQAVSRPEIDTKMQLLRLVVIAPLIFPLTEAFGLVGAAIAVVGSALVSTVTALWFATKIVDSTLRSLIETLAYPIVACVLMALVVLSVQTGLAVGPLGEFVLSVAVGIVTYVGVGATLVRVFDTGIERTIRRIRESF